MKRVLLAVGSLAVVLVLAAAGSPPPPGESAWPHRALMEAPYENSLDARYVSKPVREALVVDDMETNRPWTVFGVPDRNLSARQEMSGTLHPLSPIE